jgi:spore maturation protein CgeB
MARALNEIGVECTLWDTHRFLQAPVWGRIEERLLAGPMLERARRSLVRHIRTTRYDCTLFYQGTHYTEAEIRKASQECLVAGAHCDDPFGRSGLKMYRHLLGALKAYDWYHVNRACNVEEAARMGAQRVGLMMLYYIPWLHHPGPVAPELAGDVGHDVVFVGHAEADERVRVIRMLLEKGSVRLGVYGGRGSWASVLPGPVMKRVGTCANIRGERYRAALASSRICLAFYSKKNRDEYSHRSWEIPACGGFLLSERTPSMEAWYREGTEAEFFSTADECVEKVAFYLKNESARRRIAEAGHRRLLTLGADIHSRMRGWIGDLSKP